MATAKFDSLHRASQLVDRSIETDVAPDLADTLAGACADSKFNALASSSSRDYAHPMDLQWNLVQKKRAIPLPDAVFEQYDCKLRRFALIR